VRERASFIRLASEATDETDAIFFRRSAQVMAAVQASTPLAQVVIQNGMPVCIARDGSIVIALEWDYASLTPRAVAFISSLKSAKVGDQKNSGLQIAISGVASPKVKEYLAAQGVKLTEKVLPGPLQ